MLLNNILLIVQIVVSVGIIVLVLMQQGKGADAGAAFGSGASGTVFGARGSANFLSRTTAILATAFFLNSMALAWLAAHGTVKSDSVVDAVAPVVEQVEQKSEPKVPASDVPSVPAGEDAAVDVKEAAQGDVPSTPKDENSASMKGVATQSDVPSAPSVDEGKSPEKEPSGKAPEKSEQDGKSVQKKKE